MATNDDTWMLDIQWGSQNRSGLPRMVGPFTTKDEAMKWAELNARRAAWNVHRLAWPYLRTNPAT